ncbi:MAG: energy transducer TonB [Chitinophagaceae bacterium]
MKKIVLLWISMPFVLPALSQNDSKPGETFYMLDANFKGTPQEKAVYFIHSVKIHDSCWQFDTYNIFGPIISSEQYKDEKGNEANGQFCYYNKRGKMDSSGSYTNGYQVGSWYFINDTGRTYLQKDYDAGILIASKDFIKLDSIKKEKKDTADKTDAAEVESDFPGGQSRWLYYLSKNMVYPERGMQANKQGTVVVQFIIDLEGHVISSQITQSVEYSLDQEAMRLIKHSPTWKPATQDGKKVKSYKKQPITFRFTSN